MRQSIIITLLIISISIAGCSGILPSDSATPQSSETPQPSPTASEAQTAEKSSDPDNDGLSIQREKELGLDPQDPDTDNDGFPDGVEVRNDLDPLQKDVFLEIDYGTEEPPNRASLAEMKRTFSDAPVTNPDGSTGINLHIDVSDGLPESAQATYSNASRDLIGDLRSEYFDHKGEGYYYIVVLEYDVIDNDAVTEDCQINPLEADFERDTSETPNAGGKAYGAGNGAWVLSSCGDQPRQQTTRIILHEFGHNLGLTGSDYTGIDSTDVSFNEYRSIMNYNGLQYLGFNDGEPFDDWEEINNTMSEMITVDGSADIKLPSDPVPEDPTQAVNLSTSAKTTLEDYFDAANAGNATLVNEYHRGPIGEFTDDDLPKSVALTETEVIKIERGGDNSDEAFAHVRASFELTTQDGERRHGQATYILYRDDEIYGEWYVYDIKSSEG